MSVLNIYDVTGAQTGTVEVKDTVFAIEPNKTVFDCHWHSLIGDDYYFFRWDSKFF